MSARYRTAHPYRDLDVIDARAPRFNQATVGVVSLVAVLTGWWALLGLLALQLGIGFRYGRQYCLPCVAYFEPVVQPSEGPDRGLAPAAVREPGRVRRVRRPRWPRRRPDRPARPWPARGRPRVARRDHRVLRRCRCTASVPRLRHPALGVRPRGAGRPWRGLRRRGAAAALSHPLCTECRSVEAELAAAIRSSASTCAIGPTWRASTASRSCRPSRGGRRDRAAAGRRLIDIRRQG